MIFSLSQNFSVRFVLILTYIGSRIKTTLNDEISNEQTLTTKRLTFLMQAAGSVSMGDKAWFLTEWKISEWVQLLKGVANYGVVFRNQTDIYMYDI